MKLNKIILIIMFLIIIGVFIIQKTTTKVGTVDNGDNIKNEQNIDNKQEEKDIKNIEDKDVKNSNNIRMIINENSFDVTLYENKSSKEILKLLPLDINMLDLNNNEKYYYFKDKLPTNQEKITTINSGDIMLYGDNCLVIFYETFDTTYSYTKIGKINNNNDLKSVLGEESVNIKFIN